MSKKNKFENTAKKEQYKKNQKEGKAEKIVNKFQNYAENIGQKNKYKERIKTSYISMFLYFVLISIFLQLNNASSTNNSTQIAIIITGIAACIYNIVKSALSIKAKQSKTHNIILIILQSLFIIMFISIALGG